jgi:transposase
MLKADYTEEEKQRFHKLRYSYPNPRIMKRYEALWLHSNGYGAPEIAKLVGRCAATIRQWIHDYQDGGDEKITTIESNHPTSVLQKYKTSIIKEFTEHPPISCHAAARRIKELTGIERSDERVRIFLLGLGMRFRKVGAIPAKADAAAQEKFLKETIEPAISRAKLNELVLLYMDGVHFVQSAFLGYLWCFCPIFLRSPSGRKRYNILGAYNAMTGALTTVSNDSYITATVVVEMLHKLAKQYAGQQISVVLDNASYQHCKLVEEQAATLGIKLLFLPSYSPNLNLIERLWKFVKKKCLYNIYYETFDEFKSGIDECMKQVNNDYKTELKSLMTLKFQMIKA